MKMGFPSGTMLYLHAIIAACSIYIEECCIRRMLYLHAIHNRSFSHDIKISQDILFFFFSSQQDNTHIAHYVWILSSFISAFLSTENMFHLA